MAYSELTCLPDAEKENCQFCGLLKLLSSPPTLHAQDHRGNCLATVCSSCLLYAGYQTNQDNSHFCCIVTQLCPMDSCLLIVLPQAKGILEAACPPKVAPDNTADCAENGTYACVSIVVICSRYSCRASHSAAMLPSMRSFRTASFGGLPEALAMASRAFSMSGM